MGEGAPRFLDEPYLTVSIDLEGVERQLLELASPTTSPLPLRLRLRLASAARQVAQVRLHIRNAPLVLEAERRREDRAP